MPADSSQRCSTGSAGATGAIEGGSSFLLSSRVSFGVGLVEVGRLLLVVVEEEEDLLLEEVTDDVS